MYNPSNQSKTPATRRRMALGISCAVALVATQVACSSTTQEPRMAQGVSCGDIEADTPAVAQLYSPGTVYRAEPMKKKIFKARANQPVRTMGASIYVKSEPDLNAPYLQRALSCHAAHGSSAHPNDPLHPQTGQIDRISVRDGRLGYVVEVTSDDPRVGEEIWKRAEALSRTGGSVQVQQVSAAPVANTW